MEIAVGAAIGAVLFYIIWGWQWSVKHGGPRTPVEGLQNAARVGTRGTLFGSGGCTQSLFVMLMGAAVGAAIGAVFFWPVNRGRPEPNGKITPGEVRVNPDRRKK